MNKSRDGRADTILLLGFLGIGLIGSSVLGFRGMWLNQNARYDGENRLSEPPIVEDVNNDGIPDVKLRYVNGREEQWKSYTAEDGRTRYRLASD
jgi:hypothetical protein